MKVIGCIAAFVLSAASMWASLHHRLKDDELKSNDGIASTTTDEKNWDQANRRPVDEVFFFKAPTWMRGSKSTEAYTSSEAISSGVQANPFSE
jgi:hypothetical protein